MSDQTSPGAGETPVEKGHESPNVEARVASIQPRLARLMEALNVVMLDQPHVTRAVTLAMLSGGHVLLEGLPGVGKTQLVKGLAELCSLDFRRIQFTPDLLPADVTGSYILQDAPGGGEGGRSFRFQPGPVFSNIVLCDEINRASPKTQSALLEAMAEHGVTVMGETHRLPEPFFVIATQNPIELEGTYPLPEAQVDRFLFKVHVGRPGRESLKELITGRVDGTPPAGHALLSDDDFREAMAVCRDIHLSDAVAGYISRLVEATHPESELASPLVGKYVRYGASPRAAIALALGARAIALIEGRTFCGFDEVRELFPLVMNHRIILDYTARMDGVTVARVMEEVLNHIDVLEKKMPAAMKGSA